MTTNNGKRYDLVTALHNTTDEAEISKIRKQLGAMNEPTVKRFESDAVIGNNEYDNTKVLFRLDAQGGVVIKNDCYMIKDKVIRSADTDIVKIELRGKHAYGTSRRKVKGKEQKPRHLFNIDLVVTTSKTIWITPVLYFYESNYTRGIARVYDWIAYVYEAPVPKATKPQIRKVLEWIVELSTSNKYSAAPDFELYKKASVFGVVECLEVLLDTGCIIKEDKQTFYTYKPTDKGKHAIGK